MPITARVVAADTLDVALDAIDELMQRAYRAPSLRNQILLYATDHPAAIVVAEDGDELVGAGACIAYPAAGFGWIGLIATEPTAERRGVGRLVTERTAEVLSCFGCAPVLDASLSGGPLYERMGFDDFGFTTVLTSPARGLSIDHSSVTVLDSSDVAGVDAIVALDAAAFGVERRPVLDRLVAQYLDGCGVLRDHDGAITGFVIVHPTAMGPMVARGSADLAQLAAFACSRPGLNGEPAPVRRVNVAPESGHLDALVDLGFEVSRALRHMRLGSVVVPTTPDYAARITLGVG